TPGRDPHARPQRGPGPRPDPRLRELAPEGARAGRADRDQRGSSRLRERKGPGGRGLFRSPGRVRALRHHRGGEPRPAERRALLRAEGKAAGVPRGRLRGPAPGRRRDRGRPRRGARPVSAVWAWVEDDPEVMGDAADLAEQLEQPALAFAAGADPELLAQAGAERVHVCELPYAAETHAPALLGCLEEPPSAVLLPGSASGSDLAPSLAAGLGAACLLDCAGVVPVADGLEVVRWAFDDRAQERWHVPAGLPLVATMRPGGRGAP